MKNLRLTKYLILSLLMLSSCKKTYKCACDADGLAPIQNDYVFEVEAESKSEAKLKCYSQGDECGLYPL